MRDLASLVAQALPADLLMPQSTAALAQVEPPFTLVSSSYLGPGRLSGESLHLLLVEDSRGARFGMPAVAEPGRVRRAVPGDGASQALVSHLAHGHDLAGLTVERFDKPVALHGEQGMDADSRNEHVLVGDQAVVAWVMEPSAAGCVAAERMAVLARAGFTGMPALWAVVRVMTPDGPMVTGWVTAASPGASSGPTWATSEVRQAVRAGGHVMPEFVRDVARLVAAMHAAFAADGIDVASQAQAQAWYDEAMSDVDGAVLSSEHRSRAHELITPLRTAAGTLTITLHGRLDIAHVVPTAEGTYLIVGFDGDPREGIVEQRTRRPAARDVACMLASLDHLGQSVLTSTEALGDTEREHVNAWIEDAQVTFVDAYFHALIELDSAELLVDELITAFQVQQECREHRRGSSGEKQWWHDRTSNLHGLLDRPHP